MTVVSIHPGVTREQIQDNCGWTGALRRKSGRNAGADAQELEVLRELQARTARAHARRRDEAADVFICDAVRTPIGRYGGALAKVRTDDLAAVPIKALMARNPKVDWAKLDEVYLRLRQPGRRGQPQRRAHGAAARRPARAACRALTLNRLCASGLEAVGTAARAIRAGEMDFAIAGGVESMTRAPFVHGQGEEAFSRTRRDLRHHHRLALHQSADEGAIWRRFDAGDRRERRRGIPGHPRRPGRFRAALAAARRAAPWRPAIFAEEIVAVEVAGRQRRRRSWSTRDEHPRPDTTLEQLAKLRTPFRNRGTVTAGNASGVNDGAAALIVASEEAVKAHGLTPRARILGMASAAVPPRIMGIGPVPATQQADGAARPQDRRFRRDRAQRGLRLAVARRACASSGLPTMPNTSIRMAAPSRSAIRSACRARGWR